MWEFVGGVWEFEGRCVGVRVLGRMCGCGCGS